MAQFCYLQLYLGIKIVSCRLDGHGLKLAVVGPLQSLMLCLQKSPKKLSFLLVLPNDIFMWNLMVSVRSLAK